MRMEFNFSGTGGQGVILLGVIMAETAINSGLNALQTQCFGPEARGGASRCEVIISEEDIHFPKVQKPDYVLCLSQPAADKFAKDLCPDTVLVVDSLIELNGNPGTEKIYSLPIVDTARNEVGREITANIVSLGAIQEITQLFSKEDLLKTVLVRVPKGTEDINTKAIEAGIELVKNHNAKS